MNSDASPDELKKMEQESISAFKRDYPDIPVIDLNTTNIASAGEVLENAMAVMEGPKFMRRDRPYGGQPHTDLGIRGKTEVKGVTFRDIRDCFIRAYTKSHPYYVYDEVNKCTTLERQEPNATLIDEANKGEKAQLNGNDVYKLVGGVDPIAVSQNLTCEIEKIMGIFPNIPERMKSKNLFRLSEPNESPNPPCDDCNLKECGDKDSY